MFTNDPKAQGPLAEFILRQNFVEAAIHGDIPALEDALDTYDINVNWGKDTARNALAGAVCSGQTEAVRFLLAHDADPDTMYHDYPLLYIAFYHGDDDIARLLISAGADVTRLEKSTGHLSILDGAVQNGDEDLVDFALAITKLAGMDMERLRTEGLIGAVAENNLRLARKFLDLGTDPDGTGPNGCYGFPPLQLAADRKNADMVRLLVSRGAKAGLHLSHVQELLKGGRQDG